MDKQIVFNARDKMLQIPFALETVVDVLDGEVEGKEVVIAKSDQLAIINLLLTEMHHGYAYRAGRVI